MRLLVIGASGFLGTHVRRQAAAAGMEVITAGRAELPGLPWHQRIDLTSGQAPIAAMLAAVAPDAIVNCAGATTGGPAALVAANIDGTHALLQALLTAGSRARLVHIGSAAEYGWSEPGVAVAESARPRPAGLYGVTKLAGTRLVQLARTAGLEAAVLRVFNPVGAGAPVTTLPGRLAAGLRNQAVHGQAVRLGTMTTARDFVDARDVADAVLAAVTVRLLPDPVLNVGSGHAVPVRAMVEQLLEISGCTGGIDEQDEPGEPRSADIPWQQADISCAIAGLGWKPRRDLAASLTDLWEASS